MKFKVDNLESPMLIDDELTPVYRKYGLIDEDGCRKQAEVELATLEDLKSFAKEFKEQLIIDFDGMGITIYDGYNE